MPDWARYLLVLASLAYTHETCRLLVMSDATSTPQSCTSQNLHVWDTKSLHPVDLHRAHLTRYNLGCFEIKRFLFSLYHGRQQFLHWSWKVLAAALLGLEQVSFNLYHLCFNLFLKRCQHALPSAWWHWFHCSMHPCLTLEGDIE